MDVSFNSVARSYGEENGVRAGRPWRAGFVAAVAAALIGGAALAQTAQTPPAQTPPALTPPAKPAPVYTPTSLRAEPGVPRTPYGRPDFQGEVWEAPYFAGLTGIPFVTPADLVITEAQSKASLDGLMKMFSSLPGIALDPEVEGLFSELKGSPVVRGQRRSRLLVLPANGRLPLTAEAQAEVNKVTAAFITDMNKADNPEDRAVTERCIFNGGAGPYQTPTMFNPLQFVQTRDHVVIHTEYADEARVAPFAARHAPYDLQGPFGDAIARWEGDTLVVETINSPAAQRLRVTPFGGLIVNPGARITEKFTRVSKDEIVYQFTVEDPKVFTGPWLGEFSLFRSGHRRMYGSHCHEGNYGLYNILAGARYEERNPPPAWESTIAETTADPALRWTTAGRTANDVRSWAVVSAKDPAGQASVALRIERNGPASIAGAPHSLSEIDVFAIDCTGQRLKMLSQATYANRNLSGEKADLKPGGEWHPAASRPNLAEGVKQACS